MPGRQGWVLRRPMPPMDDGTELEVGKEIKDFDDPEKWPNADSLRRLGWVVLEVISEENDNIAEQKSDAEKSAGDFTASDLRSFLETSDATRDVAERLLAEEKKGKKRKSVLAALKDRVKTYRVYDFTVKELEDYIVDNDVSEDQLREWHSQEEGRSEDDMRTSALEVLDAALVEYQTPADGGASVAEIEEALQGPVKKLLPKVKETTNVAELQRVLTVEEAGQNRLSLTKAVKAQIESLTKTEE